MRRQLICVLVILTCSAKLVQAENESYSSRFSTGQARSYNNSNHYLNGQQRGYRLRSLFDGAIIDYSTMWNWKGEVNWGKGSFVDNNLRFLHPENIHEGIQENKFTISWSADVDYSKASDPDGISDISSYPDFRDYCLRVLLPLKKSSNVYLGLQISRLPSLLHNRAEYRPFQYFVNPTYIQENGVFDQIQIIDRMGNVDTAILQPRSKLARMWWPENFRSIGMHAKVKVKDDSSQSRFTLTVDGGMGLLTAGGQRSRIQYTYFNYSAYAAEREIGGYTIQDNQDVVVVNSVTPGVRNIYLATPAMWGFRGSLGLNLECQPIRTIPVSIGAHAGIAYHHINQGRETVISFLAQNVGWSIGIQL